MATASWLTNAWAHDNNCDSLPASTFGAKFFRVSSCSFEKKIRDPGVRGERKSARISVRRATQIRYPARLSALKERILKERRPELAISLGNICRIISIFRAIFRE